jgi:hypothetical protein
MVRAFASLLLAAVLATPAAAETVTRNDPAPQQSRAIGGAVATYARVAVLYDYGVGVVRSKGVSTVRRVGTGHYCIKPSALTSTDVQRAVPVVSADYSGSSGTILFAHVRTGSTLCTTGEFAVQTIRGANGAFGPSNYVGFSFIVP